MIVNKVKVLAVLFLLTGFITLTFQNGEADFEPVIEFDDP